jgi:antitoxin (DNA-binding transcriptional repressor) of toxin-antitoxin stability system
VLTERGRPVARLTRIETPEGESSAELLQRLSEQSLVRRATKAGPLPSWKARKISGVPLSDTVRVAREDR